MSRPLKVGLVIPSLCYGGAERQVAEIAANLDPAIYDVTIISLSDYLPLLDGKPELQGKVRVLQKSFRFDPTLGLKFVRLLRELDLDVVHAFLFSAEILARLGGALARVPVIVGSERNSNYSVRGWRRFLLQQSSRMLDAVVANSHAGAAWHKGLYNLEEDKYFVVHNGVDVTRFGPGEAAAKRAELGIDEGAVVIGNFASFKPQKNHAYLFRTFAKLRERLAGRANIKLLLAGDVLHTNFGATEAYKANMLQLFERLELAPDALLLGNRDDVDDLYRLCDLTWLPSLHEGTPNVVLESMACGTPAIVSDVADNARLFEHGVDSFVIALEDEEGMLDALSELVTDPARRHEMSANALHNIRSKYGLQTMADKMGQVYTELFRKYEATVGVSHATRS